jgi:uncharacterized Zn finger protein (UPF0148 family)
MGNVTAIVVIIVVLLFGIFLKMAMDNQDRKDAEGYGDYKPDYLNENFVPPELSQLGAKCSNCGAAVPPSIDGHVIAHCPYCGNALPDMKPFIEEAARLRQEHQRHQMQLETMDREMQKTDLEIRKTNREVRRERLRSIGSIAQIIRYITLTIVLLPMIILLLIMAFQLK